MRTALIVPVALAAALGWAQAFSPASPSSPPDAGEPPPPVVVTGGSAPNVQDLCWILFHDKKKGAFGKMEDRYALCLYRGVNNGRMLQFVDVREVTYDFKAVQLNHRGRTDPTPLEMKKMWEDAQQKEETGKKPRQK